MDIDSAGRFDSFCEFSKINLWNRNPSGAQRLAEELTATTQIPIHVHSSVEECVVDADVIVAATSTTVPILHDVPMKPWVHINC